MITFQFEGLQRQVEIIAGIQTVNQVLRYELDQC